MKFSQHFTRDVDGIFEEAEGGGLAAFESAASFYGLEDGMGASIEMRRARRSIHRQNSFEDIVGGEPTTAKFSANFATLTASDMQDLLIGAGAPNIAALRDDLWGSTGTAEAKKIGKKLGFTNVKTLGIAFGTLPNGKRGARGVRVEPPGFLRALINAQPGIGATGADVAREQDLIRLPANKLRPVLRALGSDINATGSPDGKLETAFRSQASKRGLPVKSYTPVGDDVVIGPKSTVEALIAAAAQALQCTSVSSTFVNAALFALGHKDIGITDPNDTSKPNSKLTNISIKRFKSEAAKRGCTVRKIDMQPIPLGKNPRVTVICPPECWSKIATAANKAIEAANKKAAEPKRRFSNKISAKELQKLLMQCSNRARKTLKNDSEVKEGKFGRDTREELNRVLGKLGFKNVFVKVSGNKKTLKLSPPKALTALRKCAEKAEKKRAAKKKKAADKRKAADDLVKPTGTPMEPDEPGIEPDDDVIVVPDEADDPFDNDIEPVDLPSGDEEQEPVKAGVVATSLLAGVAGIALILLAAQAQKKKKR